MNAELTILAFAIVLGFVHVVLASHAASLQRGYRWTASARDKPLPPLTGVAGRLERALQNYVETFPFFAAAVLVAQVAGKIGALSFWGAVLYLSARVIYLILYASGVFLARSIAWNVATLGIFLILLGLSL